MTSTRNRLKLTASLATAVVATWGCVAWAQQGPVGQGLDNAGRAVRRGFQTAGQAVEGGFARTRATIHNQDVVSRVYGRLHWEKALTTSNMDIEIQTGGVAVLTGVVPDKEAKAKALLLTAETVGVNQVVDQLTIAVVGREGAAPIVPGNKPVVVPPGSVVVPPGGAVVVPPGSTVVKPGDRPI